MDLRGLVATEFSFDAGTLGPSDGAGPSDVIAATAMDLASTAGSADSADSDNASPRIAVADADAESHSEAEGATDTRIDVDVGEADGRGVSTDAPEEGTPADGAGGHVGGGGGRPRIISVDFVGLGTPMAPMEVAGVIPAANWNSAPQTQGSLRNLVSADGRPAPGGVAWSTDFLYALGIPNDPGNDRMMNGYLDPFTVASVTVTGLPDAFAASGYDVYVYSAGVVPPGSSRTGVYRIGVAVQTLTQTGNTAFDGGFRLASAGNGGNYVVFHDVSGASFTLTATPGPGTLLPRSPLNGIQIVSHATSP